MRTIQSVPSAAVCVLGTVATAVNKTDEIAIDPEHREVARSKSSRPCNHNVL